MNLYLLHYNNYYNRMIKRENSLSSYIAYQIGDAILNVNFNPNDGVTTEQIINWNNDSLPDYVLVVNNNEIISRWFVLECARTRGGQYRLDLKRDVIADNWNQLIQSPIFIDKAKCPVGDIAELNKENYKFNSIKQSEHLLKDESGCAWLIGYCSNKDVGDDDTEYTLSGKVRFPISPDLADYTLSTTDAYFNQFNTLHKVDVATNTKKYYGSINDIEIRLNTFGTSKGVDFVASGHSRTNLSYRLLAEAIDRGFIKTTRNSVIKDLTDEAKETLFAIFKLNMLVGFNDINSYYAAAATNNTPSQLNSILDENGKVLYVSSTQKYYTISVTPTERTNNLFVTASYPDLYNTMESLKNSVTYEDAGITWALGIAQSEGYRVSHNTTDYTISLLEIGASDLNINYTIPDDSTRQHLTDAPYDMFCMPLSSEKVFWNGSSGLQSNKEINVATAMSIVADLAGVGFVYDCQILPYCPLGNQFIGTNNRINLLNPSTHGTIKYTSAGGTQYTLGYIMFCTQSQFEFSIDYPVYIEDTKRQHQTDNWRFQSPNWASAYDFDAALNRGMTYIDVDCTYKPYTPYIHVCPRFNSAGYYGYNNNDAYGLICAGDFSMPMVTDQWKTYEYSNKNYENSFNRQIQNINTNYRYDTIERGVGALAGTASGAASGAVAGSALGPVGMAIGGALGGVASLAGGGADIALAAKRKEETVSFATDQFNYAIDNIKSLPNTISKVSAFNANNKLFPFIEHYSCSDKEKEIFDDLIKWNGATINRVGTISEFLDDEPQYFSGRLIRIEGLYDEAHMVSAIAQELAKGVFL